MIEELLLPFQFGFMQNAFIAVAIIAVPTALLSCYLVLKGWSLMGDAISHAVLPGIVVAYLLNIPLIIGAFFAGMTCAIGTGFLQENSRIKQDTVMGVVFSGMFGFGIVLYTWIQSDVHLDHILFGNMLGISRSDIWTGGLGDLLASGGWGAVLASFGDLEAAGVISLIVTMILVLKRRDLLLFSFDPAQARASGLPVRLLHYGLLAVLSLTIVATLKAVGLILAIGLLIAPGAIAFLITRRFDQMLLVAVLVTVFSGLLGVYLSFYLDSDAAPTIILVLTVVFVVCFVVQTLRAARRASPAI